MAFMAVCMFWILLVVTALFWYLAMELFHSKMATELYFNQFVKIIRDCGFVLLIVTNYKIIDKPELKSPFRYLLEGSITLFLWSLWVYWISPVLTAILWFVGIRLFHSEIVTKAGFAEFIEVVRNGGLIVLAIALLMLSWVYYNYLWFLRRGERRNRAMRICSDEDLARFFNVDPKLLEKAKQQHRVEVDLKNGGIEIR